MGRQQALLDSDDLVPASGAVEPEVESVLGRREGVLELVAVSELGGRRHDRLERRLREAADAYESVAYLTLLLLDLHLVREILKATPAANAEMPAWRVDACRARFDELGDDALGESALHLGDPRAHIVTGHAAPDEDDEPVMACYPAPAVGERVDSELELLSLANWRSHRPASVPAPT